MADLEEKEKKQLSYLLVIHALIVMGHAIDLDLGAIAGALVGIAINAIILYYLSRRNVRQYFGKVAAAKESSSTTV